jgi:hypothetical protein
MTVDLLKFFFASSKDKRWPAWSFDLDFPNAMIRRFFSGVFLRLVK